MNTYELADTLLDILDGAPVDPTKGPFTDELAKQWMESCIVRAIGKLKAAEYQQANIDSEIRLLHKEARDAAESMNEHHNRQLAEDQRYALLLRSEQDKIRYELDAFLAAARSCIDFIAAMLALHFKGMDRRTSITRLLDKARKDSANPFSGLLTKWGEWIEQLKKYRDEYVHYRTIHMTGGYKVEVRDGNVLATVLPVLVPEKVLPDKPSSRRGKMGPVLTDIHEMVGIAGVPPYAEGPLTKSAQNVLELLQLESTLSAGHIPVEDFCRQHLEKLHEFTSESMREVLALNFQSYVG